MAGAGGTGGVQGRHGTLVWRGGGAGVARGSRGAAPPPVAEPRCCPDRRRRRSTWPHECGDEEWSAHKLPGSKCYDLVWRVTLTRHTGKSDEWKVRGFTTTLEGFHGDADGPCSAGLARQDDYP